MRSAALVAGLLTPGTIKDTRGDGSHLLAEVDLFGVPHHLTMLRVVYRDDTRVAFNEEDESLTEDFYRFATVEIPGFKGEYIAVMHPYAQ